MKTTWTVYLKSGDTVHVEAYHMVDACKQAWKNDRACVPMTAWETGPFLKAHSRICGDDDYFATAGV